jgi:hypothetical protein
MIVGALGPWAKALGIVSVSGVDGDGWFVVAAAVVAAFLLWRHAQAGGRGPLVGIIVAGAVAAAVCAIDLIDIQSKSSTEFFGEDVDVIDPAWGIYACLLGSGALIVATIRLWPPRRPA